MVELAQTTLIIFAKAPVAGHVKTRMQPFLSTHQSAQLHRNLIEKTLSVVTGCKIPQIELWVGSDHDYWSLMLGTYQHNISIHLQQGEDLGQRLLFASQSALARSAAVLMIGTDCPDIDEDYLNTAAELLTTKHAVLGPAMDGGYVLLGVKDVLPGLFQHIEWGGDKVCQHTRQRLQAHNLEWVELDVLNDIDRPEDLIDLERFHPELLKGLALTSGLPEE